jgi:hypothetical protein
MADTPFISGAAGRVRLIVGGNTLMIPCSSVSYRTVRNNRVMKLIDGGTPHPMNQMQGIQATVLSLSTYLFPATGGTGWFSGDNLAAMLDLSSNNNIPLLDAKIESGADTATDQVKLAGFQLAANGASDLVSCSMTFVGLVKASVASFASYVADTDEPYRFDQMEVDFTPHGGALFGVNLLENFTLAMGTSVAPVKFSGDGRSGAVPSAIDTGTFGASASFAQRAGAQNRMDAQTSGLLFVGFDAEHITLGIDRLDKNVLPNPNGSVGAPCSFQYYGAEGVFTALTA